MSELYWDPITPELRDDPYPLWKRLRDEAPVYYNERFDFYGLSRFHDVEASNKDHDTFSSNHGTTLETMSPNPVETGMIIWLDPPKHTMLRKLVARAFTPRRIGGIEDRIREVCARLLDPHAGGGRFDYVQDFSAVLPPTVIASLLGVPEGEHDELRHLVDDVFHIEEGVGMANETSMNALTALGARLAGNFADRRTNPRDDVFTDLVEAEVTDEDGETRRLTDAELADFGILLFSAGTETVARHLGWAAWVLDDYPDQRAELAQDFSLIPNAVEELLRYEPPSPVNARWTTRDVTLHDVTIPADSRGDPDHGGRRPRRTQVPRSGCVRHPPEARPPHDAGLRHPLLPRRRAGADGEPHRPRGDVEALARVEGRPRRRGPAVHEHRPRSAEPARRGLIARVCRVIIDFGDAELWQDPYPTFAAARRDDRWARSAAGELVLLRADDLDTVHRHAAFGQPGLLALERLGVFDGPFYEWRSRSMAAHDGPVHDRLRATVVRAFTPMRVERVRASLADHARSVLVSARRRESFDVVAEYADDLPLWLICQFLGLPVDARDEIATFLAGTESGFVDPLTADARRAADDGIVALGRYVAGLVATREASPQEDLVTDLLDAEREGRLDREELVALVVNVLGGAIGSSRAAIANSILLLLRHPEQAEWVRADPDAAPHVDDRGVPPVPPAVPVGAQARACRQRRPRHRAARRRHGVPRPPGREPRSRPLGRPGPLRRHAPARAPLLVRLRRPLLSGPGARPPRCARGGAGVPRGASRRAVAHALAATSPLHPR